VLFGAAMIGRQEFPTDPVQSVCFPQAGYGHPRLVRAFFCPKLRVAFGAADLRSPNRCRPGRRRSVLGLPPGFFFDLFPVVAVDYVENFFGISPAGQFPGCIHTDISSSPFQSSA
jgi:hypothetical protein